MYPMNKIILILVTAILLTGCSVWRRKENKKYSVEEPKTTVRLSGSHIELEQIQWIIIPVKMQMKYLLK